MYKQFERTAKSRAKGNISRFFVADFYKIEICKEMGWTEKQFYNDNSIEFIRKLAIKLSADSKQMKDSAPSEPKKPRLTR